MPVLGFGTSNRRASIGKPLVRSLVIYLQQGGRLIDTAQMYGNYEDIREALAQSGVPRSDVWIISKVNTNKGKTFRDPKEQAVKGWVNTTAGARRAVAHGLRRLGVQWIDVMLIHGPFGQSTEELLAVWRGLLEAKRAGQVRVVGVSNFDRARIEALEAASGERPAVNQLEYHPWVTQEAHDLVTWCKAHGIIVIAYGSLGGSQNKAKSEVATKIAARHGVSNSQVLLRWAVDQGVVVIPGATTAAHISDNLKLKPFVLDESDLAALRQSQKPRSFRITGQLG